VWVFIDIAQVSSHTPEQLAGLASALGYTPELRIAEYFREGHATLEPVLLVHRESFSGDELASERLLNAWEDLASQIQPSTAVHLRRGEG